MVPLPYLTLLCYNVEKYRNGSNSAGFTIQMYYSTDGTNWTSAGDNFKLPSLVMGTVMVLLLL